MLPRLAEAWETEPSLDLLPLPSLWMTRTAGSPFSPITELEVKRRGLLLFPWLSEGPQWWGRPGREVPRAKTLGPHTHPWMLALLAEERSQSHVLEGHVGTECLSAPLGQAGLPTLCQEEGVTQGPMSLGAWCPGGSAWGHARAWVCWGSGGPPKEKAEEAEETFVGQKLSQAWWLPFLAMPRRRHEVTGLSPGVCIQAVCLGPSARPGPHPKEPQ